MSSPTVPYTFSNGTTADATQVNDNFSAILNHITDGTIDFSINALTVAGTAAFNGNTTLGNASTDDLTITASLASSIAIKTKNTYALGAGTLYLASTYATTTYTSELSALADVAAGITCNHALTLAAGATVSAGQSLKADTIAETTAAAGVSIDGVAIKDGGLTVTLPIIMNRNSTTISGGVITLNSAFQAVDTESAAATDDLDTINGGTNGQLLILRAANSARTVVVKDGTGNIQCAGDMSLDNAQDTITLLYDVAGYWVELARSNNGA